jgi:uncharacterized protein (DUF1800 family)
MTTRSKIHGRVLEAGTAVLVGTLCSLMAAPQAVWANGVATAPEKQTPLTQDEKVLHTLNRLTFGPRPGDEAMVRKMGLDAWFEWQLQPEKIDDAGLDGRLAEFPALTLPVGELLERYPSPQMIKAMEKQGTPLPSDPLEHAIYADSMAFYKNAQKAAEAGAPQVGKKSSDAGGDSMNDAMTPVKPADVMTATADAAGTDGKVKRRLSEPKMESDEVEAIVQLPPDQRMAKLISMSPEEMVSFRRGVRVPELLALMQGLTPQQKQDVAAMQGGAKVIGVQALNERVLRDVYSERQLQAVMDDFWLNHFSVYARKNQNEPYLLASYERDAILPNTLGKFEDLLVAAAKSPAMLMYLDNWLSIGPNSLAAQRGKRASEKAPNSKAVQNLPKGINENYGRELMELHTLGVGGGYTQKDVIEVAKCFTGWTIDRPYGGGGGKYQRADTGTPGEFVFEEDRHEPGTKTVLGHTIAEGGMNEGLEVLHILATSPATAHFVSKKLAERFVSDTPPAALVDRMAATFLKSDGDIKAVLTTIFHSPEFWSPTVYRAKVKTPIEFVASALRASNVEVKSPAAIVQAMQQLGMPIYGMQTPNGYSWKASEWVSSNALVARMNFALVLSGGCLPGTKLDWPEVLGVGDSATVAASPTPKTELALEKVILGESAGLHTRDTVLANFNDPTAQRTAEQNFAKTAQAGDADDDMARQVRLVRANAVDGGFRRGRYGQRNQVDKLETPLDTMAGLLLGSPDFQKR